MSVRAVSFSDINYWIGEGNVEAMLVIAWNDGKTPEALAWGYKGEEETIIVEMLNDVVKTDPRLFSLMRRQGGYTVDGLGFDLNGENTVALVVGGDTTYPKYGSVSTKKTIGIRLRSRKMEYGIVWPEAKAETRLRPKSIKCRYKIDIPIYFITINSVAIHRIMLMP